MKRVGDYYCLESDHTRACLLLGGPLLRDRVGVGEPRVGLIAGVVAHKQVGHAIGAGGHELGEGGARFDPMSQMKRENTQRVQIEIEVKTRFS